MFKFLILVSLFGAHAHAAKEKLLSAELLKNSKPEDWRPARQEDLLYFQLPNGRAIIELAPWAAPEHVKRVKSLAREKFWDGLEVARVQDGYVVQWMDPKAGTPEHKKFKGFDEAMPPEFEVPAQTVKNTFAPLLDKDTYADETGFRAGFAVGQDKREKTTWLLHCYGAVGVGRDNAPKSGNGTELYAVIGGNPRPLDRNVAVIGRVIQGMEVLSSLPRGHGEMGFYDKDKGEKPVKIVSIRLGTDVPEKERVNLEVMKTDTTLFKNWREARRNREEEWFVRKAGKIDACNVSIPVRPAQGLK
jgi:peptidylprolyl isomerase